MIYRGLVNLLGGWVSSFWGRTVCWPLWRSWSHQRTVVNGDKTPRGVKIPDASLPHWDCHCQLMLSREANLKPTSPIHSHPHIYLGVTLNECEGFNKWRIKDKLCVCLFKSVKTFVARWREETVSVAMVRCTHSVTLAGFFPPKWISPTNNICHILSFSYDHLLTCALLVYFILGLLLMFTYSRRSFLLLLQLTHKLCSELLSDVYILILSLLHFEKLSLGFF